MARPRKSTKLLALTGQLKNQASLYKKRVDHLLPTIPTDCTIPAPDYFDDYTKERWSWIVDWATASGIVTTADIPVLESAFISFEQARRCDLELLALQQARHGRLPTPAETEQESKLINQKYKSMNYFMGIMSKFGISPADRARLTLDDLRVQKEGNKILALLSK